jgi:hypothetical protein
MAEIFVHERCELLGALLGDAKSFGGIARGGKSAGDFDWHVSIVARSWGRPQFLSVVETLDTSTKPQVGQDRGIHPSTALRAGSFEKRERWGTRHWIRD